MMNMTLEGRELEYTDPNLGFLPPMTTIDQGQRQCMLREWKQMRNYGEGIATAFELQNATHSNILLFGGIDPLKPKEYLIGMTIFLYEPHKDKWSFYGILPEPRSYHAAVYVKQRIFVTGGFDPMETIEGESASTNTIFQLNIQSKRWHKRCAMSYKRACHGIANTEDRILVFGGRDRPDCAMDSVECYNISTDTWVILSAIPQPIMGMGVAYLDGSVYIIGGVTISKRGIFSKYEKNLSCNIYIYNIEKDSWSTGLPLPEELAYCSAVTLRREIWVFGGMNVNGSCSHVHKLSQNATMWEQPLILSTSKHALACAKIDKRVYLFGGMSSVFERSLNETDIFDRDLCQMIHGAMIPCRKTGAAAVTITVDYDTKVKNDKILQFAPDEHEFDNTTKTIQAAYKQQHIEDEHRPSKNEIETEELHKENERQNQMDESWEPSEWEKEVEIEMVEHISKEKNKRDVTDVRCSESKISPSSSTNRCNICLGPQSHPDLLKYDSKWIKVISPVLIRYWPPVPNPNCRSSLIFKTLSRRYPEEQYPVKSRNSFRNITPSIDPNLGMVSCLDNLYKKARGILGLRKLELKPAYLQKMQTISQLQDPDVPVIVFLGGFDPKDPLNLTNGKTILRYYPEADEWEFYGMMPEAKNHHAAVLIANNIYVTGGYNPDLRKWGEMVTTKSCFAFDITSNDWSRIADMEMARAHHGMVAINTKLYVIGGRGDNGRALSSIEEYDLQTNNWNLLCKMEIPCIGMAVVSMGNNIWILGGLQLANEEDYFTHEENKSPPVTSDVFCYNLQSQTWTTKSPLNSSRAYGSAVVVDGKIWLGGGCTEHRGQKYLVSIKTVEMFNPTTEEWENKTDLIVPRHCAGVAAIEHCVYIFGGVNSHEWNSLYKNDVYFLDNDTVSPVKNLPVSITGATAVSVHPVRTTLRSSSFTRIVRRTLKMKDEFIC